MEASAILSNACSPQCLSNYCLSNNVRLPTFVKFAKSRRFSKLFLAATTQNGSVSLLRKTNPVNNSLVEQLKVQLGSLSEKLTQLMEQGEEEVAKTLINANYHTLRDQLNAGINGIEQAALLDVLVQGRLDLGDSQGALNFLKELSDIMEKHTHTQQPLAEEILEHMGAVYAALQKPEQAVEAYEKSIAIQQGNNSTELVDSLLGYAESLRSCRSLTRSIEVYYRAIKILDDSNEPNSEVLSISLSGLGFTLLEDGKPVEAEIALSRALQIMKNVKKTGGKGAIVMAAIAQAKHLNGEHESAVDLYREALKEIKKSSDLQGQTEMLEYIRAEFATVLTITEKHSEAQSVLEDNLQLVQMKVGASDIELLSPLENLAVSYANSGNLERCEKLVRRCLVLITSHFGPNAPQLSGSLEMLATCLLHMGKHNEAENFARQSFVICEKEYGKDHPFTGDACECLGAVLFALERYSEALEMINRVLQIQERELSRKHPLVATTLRRIVSIHTKLGRDTSHLLRRIKDIEEYSQVDN